MSFEPLIISKWIYDTLSADVTLATLIAGSKAPKICRINAGTKKNPVALVIKVLFEEIRIIRKKKNKEISLIVVEIKMVSLKNC